MTPTFNVTGKVSHFGGPDDEGVSPDEGLAFIYTVDDKKCLFLPYQPDDTTGLARRLNPQQDYVACRWPYTSENKAEWRKMLLKEMALVRNVRTGKTAKAYPADWGPHEDTDRVADISPGLMETLGLHTDDKVEVLWPFTQRGEEAHEPEFPAIVISSGHGKIVRGASGYIDEVDEARRVVERVAEMLDDRGVDVTVFHDDTSKTVSENLDTIVNFHNAQARDLDVSVHFNAYVETVEPMGTECLYVTQESLARRVADAIAECGFVNRGPKYRDGLKFLNQTQMPSILIEVCFVDSSADVERYEDRFDEVCKAIANVLGGTEARLDAIE